MIDLVDRLVGYRVMWRRQDAGLSRADLAARLGVSCALVRGYEEGTRRIGLRRLVAIADVLNAPVADFFEEVEYIARTPSVRRRSTLAAHIDEDARDLILAFKSIPDESARWRVLALARGLAQPDDNRPRPNRQGRRGKPHPHR